jgi:hypothetical protein
VDTGARPGSGQAAAPREESSILSAAQHLAGLGEHVNRSRVFALRSAVVRHAGSRNRLRNALQPLT